MDKTTKNLFKGKPKTKNLSIGGGSFTSKLQKCTDLDKIQGVICLGKDVNIRILIGARCVEALEPLKVINSEKGGPYAFKMVLGSCVVGAVKSAQAKRKFCCNSTAVMEAGTNEIAKHHFEKGNSIAETDIKQMLNKMYESDFTEAKLGKKSLPDAEDISFEDKKFLKVMDKEAKLVDGHYQVPLPFRNVYVAFPHNCHCDMNRLKQLERRSDKN